MDKAKAEKFLKDKLRGFIERDFCEEYSFDKFADNENFNKRFNEPGMAQYLEKDRTKDLHNDITKAIELFANTIFMFYGPRNMSKSEGAQALAKYHQLEYLRLRNVCPYIRIGLNDSEMLDIFREMNEGDFSIRDESPLTSGKHSNTAKKSLINICNITRGLQVSFAFLNPEKIEVDGVDYYLEAAGKNIEKRTNRYVLYDRKHEILGVVFLELHDDAEMRELYQYRKRENMKALMANAGLDVILVNPVKWENDKEALFNWCLENDIEVKSLISAEITEYNSQFDKDTERDKMITGDNNYIDALVEKVYSDLKKHKNKKKKEDAELRKKEEKERKLREKKEREEQWTELHQKLVDFEPDKKKYSLDYLLGLIRKESNWRNTERDITIYIKRKQERYLLREIASEFKGLSDKKSVQKVIEKVDGEISRLKGELHERDYCTYLENLNLFDRVERFGDKSQPDIVAWKNTDIYVFSLKNYSIDDDGITIPVEKYYIEYIYCNRIRDLEQKNVNGFLIVLNSRNFATYLKDIPKSKPKPIRIIP